MPLDEGSALQVQAYYDESRAHLAGRRRREQLDTYDLEVQHNFSWGWNRFVWGGEYRIEGIPIITAGRASTLCLESASRTLESGQHLRRRTTFRSATR